MSVNVMDFGAIGDGTTDDSVAFQEAHDFSASHGCLGVCVPPGEYAIQNSLNWSPFITLYSHGCVTLKTNLSSGCLFAVCDSFGATTTQHEKILFAGSFTVKNFNDANTATAFRFGGTGGTGKCWGLRVECLTTSNFHGAVEFGDNAFLINFSQCDFLGNYDNTLRDSRYGILQPGAITNSGENISFNGCVFEHLNEAIRNGGGVSNNSLDCAFYSCSFDYCLRVLSGLSDASTYTFYSPHFEWDGGTTYFPITGCRVRINNPWVFIPTGTGYANPTFASIVSADGNNIGRLTLSGSEWNLPTGLTNMVYLNDTVCMADVESIPDFAHGSGVPANYCLGVSGARIYYNGPFP